MTFISFLIWFPIVLIFTHAGERVFNGRKRGVRDVDEVGGSKMRKVE